VQIQVVVLSDNAREDGSKTQQMSVPFTGAPSGKSLNRSYYWWPKAPQYPAQVVHEQATGLYYENYPQRPAV